tara:strand:+ start:1551 stop:2030 length:480 start_codon:yes stop_codon:yes gene_type:complete
MAFNGSFICNSFKNELLKGEHDFDAHTFNLALYPNAAVGTSFSGSSAIIDQSITTYSSTGEVSNTIPDGSAASGYATGGQALSLASSTPKLVGSVAIIDFADEAWSSATFTARGGIIYNTSNSKTVAVIDFGSDQTVTGGTLTVTFPAADSVNAIIRIQ